MLKTQQQREARQQALRERVQALAEAPFEEHFTVQELAALWRFSRHTVRRMAEKEPGVLRVGHVHKSLHIPVSVARRMYLKFTTEAETAEKLPEQRKPPTKFAPSMVRRSRPQ